MMNVVDVEAKVVPLALSTVERERTTVVKHGLLLAFRLR